MNQDIFNIESFNVISDENNYYFFRALNMGDINDIEKNIITTENGVIERIRTDRERYEKDPKYTEESTLTLEEIFDHIKMHHRKDTNCISLTSNANVAAMYGRGYYKDKYVMVKIPKKDIGKYIVNAGSYILEEIEKRIEEMILNGELDPMTEYYMQLIDNTHSQQGLDSIMSRVKEDKKEMEDFERGIVYDFNKTTSIEYLSLNEKQNFEKNKLIAKIDLLNKNIIKNVSNKFLIQTIGNAFSSLELTHYKDIDSEKIIEMPSEILDLFSILQQVPEEYGYVNELKLEILNYCKQNKEHLEFEYKDFKINIENDYTIEKIYNLTNGNVDFYSSIELYKKSFYLSKSKLRAVNTLNLLNKITNNNPKYSEIINYIIKNTYGVEPEIFSRLSKNKLQISESVNLEFRPKEEELFNFINNLSQNDLKYIITNPLDALNYYLKNFKSIEYKNVDKETYYANAIIDLFDWKKMGVVDFNIKQRNDIVNKLKENNVVMIYDYLKSRGIKEKDIANALLTTIIKEKELNNLDLNDTFTVEELEYFLGYYKIKDTEGLKLRSYQATALKNINKCFEEHQFCATVLPTGAGKSFVALAEMLKYKDKEILYLAPNDEILNQIENYIVKYIHGETLTKTSKEILKETFPNLKLKTYCSLLTESGKDIVSHKYDLIVFDELHRTGAMEWGKSINQLLNNQDNNTKILGITATPQRDVDYKNMANEWAKYFGYTEEEIEKHKHLAYNMDLEEAIKLGYVVNPRVVNCEYTLGQDDCLENLQNSINLIEDEEKRAEAIKKLDILRRKIEQADGIEKVIGDNVKKGGKYIVFCPAFNKNNNVVEDEDGNIIDSRISGDELLKKYQNELINCLKQYYNLSDEEVNSMVEFHSMLGEYSKTKNRTELEKFEQPDNDKIKFITVINKLNEGVHVKDIDGIIWFRPLDENSKILFLQQLGRIISSKDPNKEISDNERPIVIDLVNNILRVNLDKDKKQISNTSDLDRLIAITEWINMHLGEIPNINSNDRVESSYASSLKRIQNQYIKYINNADLLNSLDNKNEVIEILNLGNNIDLWNFEFPEKTKQEKEEKNSLYDTFTVKGLLKDYVDLVNEVEESITPLTLEEKLEEIYEIAAGKIGNVPKNHSSVKFSDNSAIIGRWIVTHKEEIKALAEAGNEHAVLIAKAKGWMNLGLEEKLQEIYELSEGKIENVPRYDSLIRFSDESANIGTWIVAHAEEIKALAEAGNEHAVLIAKAKGWMNLGLEEKLQEIYELSEGKIENVPRYDSLIRFSDESANIGTWIVAHAEEIKALAEAGNEHAVLIAKAKGWMNLGLEEKLQEIYEKAEGKVENVPNSSSKMRFSDDSGFIGIWIENNNIKIKELANEGNKYAILIAKAKGWMNLGLEEKLQEIYEKAEGKVENVPNSSSKMRFSDNSAIIGRWIGKNVDEIKELVQKGNEHAILISEARGWMNLGLEEKLQEIYKIAEGKIENVPKERSSVKFSDNSAKIGGWISDNKEKIKELAQKGNEYAILIAKARGWISILEDRLKEIYEKAEGKAENVPNSSSNMRFSDNSANIGDWIGSRASEIKGLAQKGNEYAILIAEARGWMNLGLEEKLQEIYEKAEGKAENVPVKGSATRFSDDSGFIGDWISRNADEIKVLAKQGNEHAIFVAQAKGWMNLGLEEKLQEIYEKAEGKAENVPIKGSAIRFSDDSGFIGGWISRNADEIKVLANQGNEHAIFIAHAKGWLKFEEAKSELKESSNFEKQKERVLKSNPKNKEEEFVSGRKI